MRLNTLSPQPGSRRVRKRVGRGQGSGVGKTCGRGHKGQKSRSGGYHKVGFEGGQMPLQRRLPKLGFSSLRARFSVEVGTGRLEKLAEPLVTLETLRAARLIPRRAQKVKVILRGEITRAYTIEGVSITGGAKTLIEKAGGTIKE